jgi:hypothetical protein
VGHDLNITEPAESTAVTGQPRYDDRSELPSGLGQAAAAVAIAAGVVFVVAVVFFSGFFLGGYRGGYGGFDGRFIVQMGPGEKPGGCPMMGGDGLIGPTPLPPTPVPRP